MRYFSSLMYFGTEIMKKSKKNPTLFCNDVMRYMYRDTMSYINMPNQVFLLYTGFIKTLDNLVYLNSDTQINLIILIVNSFKHLAKLS